ncbi:MAG: hypothetical protein K8W52_08190 [Deltaproteobacteria bacterium]|nr:hypothetical protein [Deltaproteobacteria bacterium]
MIDVPVTAVRRRVPRALARRIDRLAVRAHRFHQLAHHPLCGAYANEIVRVGKVRLCRGCTYALVGGLGGGVLGLALPVGLPLAAGIAGVALAILGASVAWRRWFGRAGRPPKLITRLVPATALAFAITRGVLGGAWLAIAAAAPVVGLFAIYRRRGNDRAPCATCPENALPVCSGYRPMVRREQAFQRVSARWLRDAGL